MNHQVVGLEKCDGKRNFAFLMEQGTGKTWLTLADAERCFLLDKIDALLIVAPNGVHTNWVRREIPTHLSAKNITFAWRGTPSSKKAKDAIERMFRTHWTHDDRPLRIFSINVEAINSANGYAIVERFLKAFPRTMMAVDESTRIKNPDAKRSKKVCELGLLAIARRILSGTPLTRAPTDLFMQYNFLKPGLLGTKSFRAFQAEFSVLLTPDSPQMIAIMRKLAGKVRGMPQVVAKDENGIPMFKNLDKLAALIAPHSYRVTKAECLDLPPKVYKVLNFELTPNQRRVYQQIMEEYSYVLNKDGVDEDVSFEAIAARTKLKQVTSGFINIYGEPQLLPPEDNPRMALFKDTIDMILERDESAQIIVWAMFEQELLQIKAHLDSINVNSALYYGKTSKDERERIIDEFQGGQIQVFIGHAAAAGIGITLTAAETAIYYSCSYDNELRMQSEDRNHRIGTKNTVTYYDLVAEDTLDEDIARSLSVKSELAAIVIDGKEVH
jgi:SNF2 family DNA or RNA helicase